MGLVDNNYNDSNHLTCLLLWLPKFLLLLCRWLQVLECALELQLEVSTGNGHNGRIGALAQWLVVEAPNQGLEHVQVLLPLEMVCPVLDLWRKKPEIVKQNFATLVRPFRFLFNIVIIAAVFL